MSSFAWFPIGTSFGKQHQTAKLLEGSDCYQIISLMPDDKIALVLRGNSALFGIWYPLLQPMIELGRIINYPMGNDQFYIWLLDKNMAPIRVLDMPQKKGIMKGRDLVNLARAMRALPNCNWGEALYLPSESLCIPTQTTPENLVERRKLAVMLLTGGVGDPTMSVEQVRHYNTFLTIADIQEFLQRLGIVENQQTEEKDLKNLGQFKLEGRSDLEEFFNEYVIDYYRDRTLYEEMEIRPPNGLLLYGPPGTGKTYAVKQLAKFLEWPVRQIDFGTIGSPYIHQTGLRLRQEFELAAQEAPSIIIMDEIDAMGTSRGDLNHHTQVEEISELLRMLETAAENNILVVATTNRIEAIDPALLRKGRFDYHLQVNYASPKEIKEVLQKELNKRSVTTEIELEPYIEKLQNKPLSDIAWFINEAGRLAVRHKRNTIDDWCLHQAFKSL